MRLDLEPDAFNGDPIGRAANQSGHVFLVGMLPASIGRDLGASVSGTALIILLAYAALEIWQIVKRDGQASDSIADFAFVSIGVLLAFGLMSYYAAAIAILFHSAMAWSK